MAAAVIWTFGRRLSPGGRIALERRAVLSARTTAHAAGSKAVPCGHGNGSAAPAGGQVKGPTVHLQRSAGADGIPLGGDGEGPIRHIQKAQSGVICVFGVESVLAGDDGEIAARHGQAVLTRHAVLRGGDGVAAAGDGQLVLGYHAVARLRVNGQTAGTVEGQVGLGEHHGIDVVLVDGNIAAAVGQGVFRPLRQGEEHFVGALGIDGGGIGAGEACAGQDDLHLIGIPGVHHDLTICQGAGHQISTLVQQGDPGAVDGDSVGITNSSLPLQLDVDGGALIVASIQIPVAEQGRRVDDGHRFCAGGCRVSSVGSGICVLTAAEQQRKAQQQWNGDSFHVVPPVHSPAAPVSCWHREISRFPLRWRRASISAFSCPPSRRVRS